jgi:hypothetical protein
MQWGRRGEGPRKSEGAGRGEGVRGRENGVAARAPRVQWGPSRCGGMIQTPIPVCSAFSRGGMQDRMVKGPNGAAGAT